MCHNPAASSAHEPLLPSAAAELGLLTGAEIDELDRLTALAADVCAADFASFTVHDANLAYQVSTSFGICEVMPNVECICSTVMRAGAVVTIVDARADPAVSGYRHVVRDLFLRSFAGVAVGVEADEVIGVLAIGHAQPGRFGERETVRLERIGALVRAFLAARRDAVRAQRLAELKGLAQHDAERGLNERNMQLGEALAIAERANRAKSDFVGIISHELRTPMNAILGCATLLSRSALDPAQHRTLGVLQDAGRQMQVLLNDLIDLSSLEADKVKIQPEPVSLLRLLEDAAAIWAADIRAKNLGLSVMIDPGLARLRDVDGGRLLQIVGNLMSNAIKFTDTGDVSLRAWPAGVGGGGDVVTIEIEDTGLGVPADAADRIFSPFEQMDTSPRRAHGGLGLGLYVARRLAISMGGGISLVSAPGEGSRFVVTIRAPVSNASLAPPQGSQMATPGGRRILCVDDNPRNLFVFSALLGAAGHDVAECASGGEALERLAREAFDVILLDMVMPGMDGIDMLNRLRAAQGPNKATPVIACTANVLSHQVKAYLDAGSCFVVPKPIDAKALLEAIAAAT